MEAKNLTTDQPQPVVYIVSQELAKVCLFKNIPQTFLISFQVSSLLPSNKNRSMIVHSLINSLGLMNPSFSQARRLRVVTPRRATYRDLAVYHTRDYLEMVLGHEKLRNPQQDSDVLNKEFGLEDVRQLFSFPTEDKDTNLAHSPGLSSLPRSRRLHPTSRRRHANRSGRPATKHS